MDPSAQAEWPGHISEELHGGFRAPKTPHWPSPLTNGALQPHLSLPCLALTHSQGQPHRAHTTKLTQDSKTGVL